MALINALQHYGIEQGMAGAWCWKRRLRLRRLHSDHALERVQFALEAIMPDEGLRKELVRLKFVCVMPSGARQQAWTRSHQRVLVECVRVINEMSLNECVRARGFMIDEKISVFARRDPLW